jgi:hypothetical protein
VQLASLAVNGFAKEDEVRQDKKEGGAHKRTFKYARHIAPTLTDGNTKRQRQDQNKQKKDHHRIN